MADTPTIINNTKDWYDLADTIVKIGLGAFIAGGFTYLTNKSNHKHEFSKEKFNRKITMLSEATGLAEQYFKSTFILMDRWYGLASKDIKRINELPELSLDKYLEIDKSYIDNTRNVQYALAQFNILGLKELAEIIMVHDKDIVKLRNAINSSNEDIPSKEEIKELISNVSKIREPYYEKVKEYFENLK